MLTPILPQPHSQAPKLPPPVGDPPESYQPKPPAPPRKPN